MGLVELVLAVHAALDRAEVSHAFGGALALGYIAEPRGTVDVDVNVFLDPTALPVVDEALDPIGLTRGVADGAVPVAGVRFEHATDPFPVDIFPSLDPLYAEIEARRVLHRFGPAGTELPFLSAEDLCVFKLSFGRPKDWVDLAAIVAARPELDVDDVERTVVGLRGPTMYPRVTRLRGLQRR